MLSLCGRRGALALDVLQQGLVVGQAQAAERHGAFGRQLRGVQHALFQPHLRQVVPGVGEIGVGLRGGFVGARGLVALADPLRADVTELSLMGTEKLEALSASAASVAGNVSTLAARASKSAMDDAFSA